MILLLLSGVISSTIVILSQSNKIEEIAKESKELIDAAVKQYGAMFKKKGNSVGD